MRIADKGRIFTSKKINLKQKRQSAVNYKRNCLFKINRGTEYVLFKIKKTQHIRTPYFFLEKSKKENNHYVDAFPLPEL